MREHNDLPVGFHESYEDRSLRELVSGVGKDMGLLIRQEVQLAKAEISEKVSHVTQGAVTIGAGAFLAYAGVLALTAALVLAAIAIGITPWLAALVVSVLLIVAGYVAIQGGRRRMTQGPPPLQRTKQTSQATVQHIKERLQ